MATESVTMLDLHHILVQLHNDLGYAANDEGACALYAEKAIDAFLAGERDVFNFRNQYISKKYTQFPGLFFQAKEEGKLLSRKELTSENAFLSDVERQMIFDVAAFFDQGELYMQPERYTAVFGTPISQNSPEKIAYYAQPLAINRHQLDSFSGIYTEKELHQYIISMRQLAQNYAGDFALSLGSDNHRIGLCYSHSDNCWQLNDVNQPDLPPIPAVDANDQLIAYALQLLFNDKDNNCAFITRLITTNSCKERFKAHVDGFFNEEHFKNIHEITTERLQRVNSRGATLAWIAAKNGDAKTLDCLTRFKADNGEHLVDFNQSTKDGITPACVAANNGDIAILHILENIKKADGTHLVNFNKPALNGVTPAYMAALTGQPEALRFLAQIKDADGKILVDFNLQANDGATPAFIAANKGNDEVLSVLVSFKTPDGAPLVDFNLPTLNGATPAFIASQEGYTKTLRVLANLKSSEGMPLIDFNKSTIDGATPVFIATLSGHAEILRILTGIKTPDGLPLVDFNKPENNGFTPVYMAVQLDQIEALRVLASIKAPDGRLLVDFNKPSNDGVMPIFIAVSNGNLEIVKLLIDVGVKLDCLFDGRTPLQFAEGQGHIEIASLLRAATQDKEPLTYRF